MGLDDLVINKVVEFCQELFDTHLGDLPPVIKGAGIFLIFAVIIFLLYKINGWWGWKGYLWIIGIWLFIEFLNLFGGAYSSHK